MWGTLFDEGGCLFVWEVQSLEELSSLLESVNLRAEDVWSWSPDCEGVFLVKNLPITCLHRRF